jgi:DNA-binding SARP family transcriptional activator
MDIGLLGPIEVRDDHRLVKLPSRQVRRVVAALALTPNRVVSIERLTEVLWEVQPPESAANTLQTYVLHLRDALEPGRRRRDPGRYVLRKDPGYLLAVAPDAIDATRFRDLAARGRRALNESPQQAAALLRDALALWRGDPLADFAYDLFAQPAIVELRELRMQALESRIDADMAVGRHAGLIGELRELVRDQPMRERLCGQLMMCLYRSGQQAEALAAFTQTREFLVDELGVEPGPLLADVHRAILNHDPVLNWSPPDAIVSSGATAPARPDATGRPDATPGGPTDVVQQGLAALQRRDWAGAYELFLAAQAGTEPDAQALDGLAEAAMWLGEYEFSLATRQRAHAAFLDAGDVRRAAMTAIALALHYAARLKFAVAAGWYGRAERLLADESEGVEHGYLAWTACLMAIGARQDGPALDAARRTFKIGTHMRDPTLHALGLTFQGYLLVRTGELNQGLSMLDEGMAAAVSGLVAPFPTSLIFCRMIDTCQLLGDYERATEWLDAIDSSPITPAITSYPSDCETHRTQLLVGRGAWAEAERLARRACAGMQKFDVSHAGLAFYQLGELHLRTGDLDDAAAAFARAAELGTVPQPGAALLDRCTGQVARAAATLAAALADESWDSLARARLLPTEVQLALEVGDPDRARAAAVELAELAEVYPSKAIAAAASTAAGAISLAEGDTRAAVAAFRNGRQAWAEAGARYDAAHARVMLARALAADGRSDIAASELSEARAAFTHLGAALDMQAVDALLAELADRPLQTAG